MRFRNQNVLGSLTAARDRDANGRACERPPWVCAPMRDGDFHRDFERFHAWAPRARSQDEDSGANAPEPCAGRQALCGEQRSQHAARGRSGRQFSKGQTGPGPWSPVQALCPAPCSAGSQAKRLTHGLKSPGRLWGLGRRPDPYVPRRSSQRRLSQHTSWGLPL